MKCDRSFEILQLRRRQLPYLRRSIPKPSETHPASHVHISQATLRSVLAQAELDELLSQRDKINLRLQEIIDHQTDPWGIIGIGVSNSAWNGVAQ